MSRYKIPVFLAAAGLAVGTAAFGAASAQAAPSTNVCGDPAGHDQSAFISTTPVAEGLVSTVVNVDLTGNSITAKCHATLDFGDGQTVTLTTNQLVQHTYAKTGVYTILLTLNWPGYTTQAWSYVTYLAEGPKGQAAIGRLSGADRLDTAVAISKNQWNTPDPKSVWGQAHTAVIATSANFPDALSGVPLAAYKQGPLLLTDKDALYGPADMEINRIVPKGSTLYVLGGAAVLSPAIDAQLTAEGYKVQRFAGNDRFETSLLIAKQGLNDSPNVVVATGRDFPDALSAGPLAAGPRMWRPPNSLMTKPAAVILTDGSAFSDATVSAYVAGKLGTAAAGTCNAVTAVGGAATAAVAPLVGAGKCWDNSLAGTDRYDTNSRVMSKFHTSYVVGLATGEQFPDALAGGAYVANLQMPLLLTDPDNLSYGAGGWFEGMGLYDGVSDIKVFGGTKAVSNHVVDQVTDAAHTGSYIP